MALARLPLTLLLIALAFPSWSSAQDDWMQPWSDSRDRPPRVDISVSGGVMMPTDWSDLVLLGSISSLTGIVEQVLVRDLRVDPHSNFGGAVTYWQGRYGFRVNGAFSRSTLRLGSGSLTAPEPGSNSLGDVDVWLYDARGVIGLLDYAPERHVWPYGFIGFGGVTYDIKQPVRPPLLTFIEGGRTLPFNNNGDVVIVGNLGQQFVVAINELHLETKVAFTFGVGADFRIPVGKGGIGVRVEGADHISESPVGLRIRELSPDGGLGSESAVHFGSVHHLQALASFVVQFGK